MRILVTGGSGFIGSHFVRLLLREQEHTVINIDKLTYAGNKDNLKDVEQNSRYRFVKGDICDGRLVLQLAGEADAIVNFAAETHVDRSIRRAQPFVRTDVLGVHVLLDAARAHGIKKFIHISTDEVYGSIGQGSFTEDSPLLPNSPYAASKAGGDLLVRSYYHTYGIPVLITRSSNNYGPYQHPEKFIPLFITNLIQGKKVPLYGDGLNVRDWLHVEDNCEAIHTVLKKGKPGEIYNIGGECEKRNKEVVRMMLDNLSLGEEYVSLVPDRLGHDRRYSLNIEKMKKLGWKPRIAFKEGLAKTIEWYKQHEQWWKPLKKNQ